MANPYLAAAAIMLGMGAMQFGFGLFGLYVPTRLTATGVSPFLTSLVVTGWSFGFLLGCRFAPGVIATLGHVRAFAVFAALLAAMALVFALPPNAAAWGAARVASGFCGAATFAIAESWLADRTPAASRGGVLSAYMIAQKVMLVVAPLVFASVDLTSAAIGMLASVAFSLAMVPIILTKTGAPDIRGAEKVRVRELFSLAPAAFVAAFGAGFMNAPMLGILPVYAVQVGLAPAQLAQIMIAMQIATVALQWPLGKLSDRIDRRLVIVVCCAVGAASALAMGWAGPQRFGLFLAAAAVWGGFSLSFYAICLAHINDHARPAQMVHVAGGLLLVWATGSMFGPLIAGAAMEALGPEALFGFVACVALFVLSFTLWRMRARAPVPVEARDPFLAQPPTATPGIGELTAGGRAAD
jgi:MFS family permease